GYDELLRLVDIVKVDCLGVEPDELAALAGHLRKGHARLLAEKVESPEMFRACEKLGFEMFQGFFFARPDLLHGRLQSVDRSSLLLLLAKLQEPETTPE